MNAHAFIPKAETVGGRHRFTVDDVDRMTEIGILSHDQSTELLDGELLNMASEGEVHLTFKDEIVRVLVATIDRTWRIIPDGTIHLSVEDAPEPDFYVVARTSPLKPVDPSAVPLVIEIADSSIAYDLGRKAGKYAQYGLNEYWVVDVNARKTHVLSRPGDGAYHDIASVPFDQILVCQGLSTLSFRFDDLVPAAS